MRTTNADLLSGSPARRLARVTPGSARSLLLTLLGEFVLPKGRAVWTSTLLRALLGLGVAEKAARQAISRAASAGWIESRRDGRQVSWILTPRGRALMEEGLRRVDSMSRETIPWDGRWLVLVATLPEAHRTLRAKLYRALHWVGFGSPLPGLWVNPHTEREQEARRIIRELGVPSLTFAFSGPSLDLGVSPRELVERAWDLPAVSKHYDGLLKRFGGLRPRSDDSILVTHVQLVSEMHRLPLVDPGLPTALLPPGWNGRRVAARMETLRGQWRGAAHARWDALESAKSSRR